MTLRLVTLRLVTPRLVTLRLVTLRTQLAVGALSAGLAVTSMAGARAPDTVTVDVDARAPGAPLEQVWAYYGYDEVNYTTTDEGEALLGTLAEAHTQAVRVRTHFLFNTGDGTPALKWGSTNLYDEDAAGNPVYSYGIIDRVMDTTVAAGALPFVEIGFMPKALSTRPEPYENSHTYGLDGGCFYPPRDYERWGALVSEYAAHVEARYPGAEQDWQWELWNEPDIAYWQGSFEEYTKLYDYTEDALHGVLPQAALGAPAVTNPEGDFLADFLEHCATGTNAVTGARGTRLDLVSFHAKGGVTLERDHVRMDLGNQLRLHRAGFRAVAESEFARKPIVISEADPDGCAACLASVWPQYAYRYSPAYGAYEVAMMKHSLDLATSLGVHLRGVLTWAFTFPGSSYFAGYRALSTNGIHMPVLNAFKLLGSLAGARLSVTSSGALGLDEILENGVRDEPDIDALATLDGDRVRVVVWNYHDDLVDATPVRVTLRVSVPGSFGARARVTQTRVDDQHGNAFRIWESQGSPTTPSNAQLDALRGAMEPVVVESQRLDVDDGVLEVALELPRFGISLFTAEFLDRTEPTVTARSGSGCSLGLNVPTRSLRAPLLVLAVTVWTRRRRKASARGPAATGPGERSARSCPRPPARERCSERPPCC